MLEAGGALGLPDEAVHDGVLLLDRTTSAAGAALPRELLPLLAAAAVRLAAAPGGGGGAAGAGAGGAPGAASGAAPAGAPPPEAVAAAMGVDAAALGVAEWRVSQLLGGDTLAISAMRCLKIYLERMGYR